MNQLIGRAGEQDKLTQYMQSGKAEFVAVYGRRRVGKTFLIDSFFKCNYAFSTSGIIGGKKEEEIEAFYTSLVMYGYKKKSPKTWMGLFGALRELLTEKLKRGKNRCVIFIDELPCFDTTKSGFIHALDYFWNSWAAKQNRIFFIICGSATSWIMRNIINNRGGLHNRLTHEIRLHPFTLQETELYLKKRGARWSRLNILHIYMALGGIPYYLSLLNVKLSPAVNIDQLFFSEDAELKQEYNRLYASLFKNPEHYINVVETLAKCQSGISRKELADKLKIKDNGHFGNVLSDLENCGFIRQYNTFNKVAKVNGGLYQIIDFFTIFYLTFAKQKSTNPHFWSDGLLSSKQNNWYGLAFERVCMAHIQQIKKALGIDRIHSEYYSWRSKDSEHGAQIDLVIDRADNICNICEMKYSHGLYSLKKNEYFKIINRGNVFQEESASKKGIQYVIITTFGLTENLYSNLAQHTVNLNDIFN